MHLSISCFSLKNIAAHLAVSSIICGVSSLSIANAANVTLSGRDRPEWVLSSGVTVGSSTTTKLSEITSTATVSSAVQTAITNLNSAIRAYGTTPTAANKTALDAAVTNYNSAVTAVQGSGATAAGLPTILFNDDTTLTATAGTAEQRLNVGVIPYQLILQPVKP